MMPQRRDYPPSLASTAGQIVEVLPYSKLYHIYDRLMWHIDYVSWTDYIYQLFTTTQVPRGKWCEGACGSGTITLRLAYKDVEIVAFDFSETMIQTARDKATIQGFSVPFEVSSFLTFSFQNLAAFFTVYDSLNYLLTLYDVEKFFLRVYDALLNNGLFLFDLCTERNCIRNLNHWIDLQCYGEWTYRRHSWYGKEDKIHHNDFEIRNTNDPTILYLEKHQQRIYTIDEIVTLCGKCGFQVISVYANMTTSIGSEKSDRVHILARKTNDLRFGGLS